MLKHLMNNSSLIIMISLLSIVLLSVMLYFDAKSPVLHVLLAISFLAIGVGILFGFVKMVSDDS